MPRTKQIHPRNLKDKIEEAQKELNGAEVSKKVILEAGIKGAPESLKGVKRKKIVAENHLKKIPKSPLRNPLQAKHKSSRDPPACPASQHAPEPPKKQSHSHGPLSNGKPVTRHNGEAPASAASKVDPPLSPKKPSVSQHPPEQQRRRRQQRRRETPRDPAPAQLSFPDEESQSEQSGSSPGEGSPPQGVAPSLSSASSPSSSSSPASTYPNTAFDVLLRAMEPELSSLSQKGPSSACAVQADRPTPGQPAQAPRPSPPPPSLLKPSLLGAPEEPATPAAEPRPSCCPYSAGPAPQKQEPAAGQPQLLTPGQPGQQLPAFSGFGRPPAGLQSSDGTRLEHVCNIVVASPLALAAPFSGAQVIPPSPQADPLAPAPLSPARCVRSPPAPPLPAAGPGVEHVCGLLLKEQKPKKPGKYICEYCSRACAKPSVLLKHIRSHTGERPYPCVTCGFSFKTKSNLYKHKKSHAHTIKLGLVLQPDAGGGSGGLFLSRESPKVLGIHSDAEDSGESDEDEDPARPVDVGPLDLQPAQVLQFLPAPGPLLESRPPPGIGGDPAARPVLLPDGASQPPALACTTAELPQVVVHPVGLSPPRTDTPQAAGPMPGPSVQKEMQTAGAPPHQAWAASSLEAGEKPPQQGDRSQPQGKQEAHGGPGPGPGPGPAHAQLQRQQATEQCQEPPPGKLLLSPRSLGSTDSGYFSRSESADQAASPLPTPFTRTLPAATAAPEQDPGKSDGPPAPRGHMPVPPAAPAGQMRPPLATKTLEERISKLISDNEALVDDKQLDSVKPRRTSLSRRGSIDSPKSYIFKDSFQFDLKPSAGRRRTSSSSDLPRSPFTPTDKSKPVFLLSVPSLDCLPITRSNSMPATGYSAVAASLLPAPPPLRGSQSFDDKIGALCDDVFVPGPHGPGPQSGHPRPLVRQAAVEDSPAGDAHPPGAGQPAVEESPPGPPAPLPEKKKSHQGRGTMFECETCRNRYRKLENFENHKKFYCSELHGPKTKVPASREQDHGAAGPGGGGAQPQILHYRVAGPAGAGWEQTPQIRKRRKMKSVGDDDDPQLQQDGGASPRASSEGPPFAGTPSGQFGLPRHSVALVAGSQPPKAPQLQGPQIQPLPGPADRPKVDPKLAALGERQAGPPASGNTDAKRHGAGISVIQHTNALSRPSSLDKPEPLDKGSPSVPFQEPSGAAPAAGPLKTAGVAQEELHPSRQTPLLLRPSALRGEPQEGPRTAPGERHAYASGQPSRLVRQHHIQVPEILVTEEPDRDLDAQGQDPERVDKFSWPQRSETLSKLPTEKLPPKKKRLRLADVERSSTGSSFESALSRSLSRDSSLSQASGFSASLDIDEAARAEPAPRVDFLSRAEFLTLPAFPAARREMRRASSEQIGCAQTSMEVSDFRSKSFDCGTVPLAAQRELAVDTRPPPPTSSCGSGLAGHVPLLERRRGPLIRQISLSISPDLSPLHPAAFQAIALPAMDAAPFQETQPLVASLAELPPTRPTPHAQVRVRGVRTEVSNPSTSAANPVHQQPFCISLFRQIHGPLDPQMAQASQQVSAQGVSPDPGPGACGPSKSEQCFAPKYQLQCQPPTPSQPCPLELSVNALPTQVLPSPAQTDPAPLMGIPSEPASKPCPPPPLPVGPLGCQAHKVPSSFTLPGPLQGHAPALCFASPVPLPQILVTQDLSSQPACQSNHSLVPVGEEQNFAPRLQRDHQNVSPNSEEEFVCRNVFTEMDSPPPASQPLPTAQKMSVGRLSPQQESSASSKRMLSPANSLDIAMEKHQKRAKDENGAACGTESRPLDLPLGSKTNEIGKHKKPVLVRQVCTTEPLEGTVLEQDLFPQPEAHTQALTLTGVVPTDQPAPGHPEPTSAAAVRESQDLESPTPSTLPAHTLENSPVSSENTPSRLTLLDSDEGKKSPGLKSQGGKADTQAQGGLPTPLPGLGSRDKHQLPFPSLKTTTSFTWCYLLRQKALHLLQRDRRTSAYSDWTVSGDNPNPLGLPTKVALALLDSKQRTGKSLYCQAITTHCESDLLVYSSKRALGNQKSTVVEFSNKDASEINSEQDKENSLIKSEPRRIKIFDGGYKSNEEYVYIRGRGRGKYICEECGIRCKKPSMLKKHIRTHTDVRPYHCAHCNFSFKTKGNLTKHVKSKTHSKKCLDLGVAVGLIDEQDAEEPDEKQRLGCERSGYDLEDSDGPEEDDNDNDEEDEDSQAESVLSAAPSVTASPQHLPSRGSLADEDAGLAESFPGAPSDPSDALHRALPTKMTVLGGPKEESRAAEEDASGPTQVSARPLCHQMSFDHPDSEEALARSLAGKAATSAQGTPLTGPAPGSEAAAGVPSAPEPQPDAQEEQKRRVAPQPPPGLASVQTRLFSHLPLHSQQPAKTPYNPVPVGGIHVVPAGLTYSAVVPVQAGPVQLTIPTALNVLHTTVAAPGGVGTQVPGQAHPMGVTGLSTVVPCFPVGQIRVPGLPGLTTPGLRPLPSLSMEAVNLVGLASTNVTPQVHPPPGLALNALELQVMAAGPTSQSRLPPQAHIPGLQIVNIALPALIPSVGQVGQLALDAQVTPETPASSQSRVREPPAQQADPSPGSRTEPQGSLLQAQREPSVRAPDPPPAPAKDSTSLGGPGDMDTGRTAPVSHAKPAQEPAPRQDKPASPAEPLPKRSQTQTPLSESLGQRTLSPDRQTPRPRALSRRQAAVHFSDVSSDDDEDRLVIAT